MSELNGIDAFEHVVAQLIDQVADRTRDLDKRRTAEAERNDAIRDLANLKQELGVATVTIKNYRDADDAISDLYDLVESAYKIVDGPDPQLGMNLRKAVAAAKKFIDPIPF